MLAIFEKMSFMCSLNIQYAKFTLNVKNQELQLSAGNQELKKQRETPTFLR